ncbi:MAG: hypothetical protein CVU88_04430 [Firmicutes bacterium HGW-Firmicutes-13]|nr:MAG: hypothetical protein CVU88_04430 [Firmicutes bacterium HGW-Firmicutes-13]
MNKPIKLATPIFIIGILIGFSASIAFASTATSPWGYYGPHMGYNYRNHSQIETGTSPFGNLLNSYAKVEANPLQAMPTGYMGTQGRIYDTSGVLISFSDWGYNNEGNVSIASYTHANNSPQGYYYGRGQTRAYNGNGYTTYWTFSTPNIYYEGR